MQKNTTTQNNRDNNRVTDESEGNSAHDMAFNVVRRPNDGGVVDYISTMMTISSKS